VTGVPEQPDLSEQPGPAVLPGPAALPGADPFTWVDGVPVVRPAQEIDLANADSLRAALLAAAEAGTPVVVVDMTQTAFCDSTGLNVLVRAHKQLESLGRELRIVFREPTLLRIFTVTGINSMFHLFPTLDQALGDEAEARPA
jgi:anti-anti-sigma factor